MNVNGKSGKNSPDFDEYIDRRNTGSIKYDFFHKYNKPEDVIPMWVADMDIRTLPEVTRALFRISEHGIFGYTETGESYDRAVCGWYRRNFNWNAEPSWNIKTPGVVFSIAAAIRTYTEEGDAVLIQQPVYYPFMSIITDNNRRLIVNELSLSHGRYEIDFDDFESRIKKDKVKLFILCSPHNPVCRVWTKDELIRIGDICIKHGVYVVSDEIHSDFVYTGNTHTVFADARPDLADISVICTSPTKTFNLAGLQGANIFIKNKDLRSAFEREYEKTGYGLLNTAGLAASEAAYANGQGWRDALISYLENNIAHLQSALSGTCIDMIRPEGTYLMWLDCRKLGLDDARLDDFFTNKAKLWLHKGTVFGKGGSGFMRMNIACPLKTVKKAADNIKSALSCKTGSK